MRHNAMQIGTLALAAAAIPCMPCLGQAEFIELELPTGSIRAEAYAVSADGSTVVGRFTPMGETFTHACRWTIGGPFEPLDVLVASPVEHSIATCVNADGSIAAGGGPTALCPGNLVEAIRWTNIAEPLGLATACSAYCNAMSDDGSIIAGGANFIGGPNWRFDAAYKANDGAWQQLPGVSGDCWNDYVNGCSPDGRFLVGGADTEGFPGFLYDTQTALQTTILDLLPDGSPTPCGTNGVFAFPYDVNADGTMVVGYGLSTAEEAFLWRPATGTLGLGDFGAQLGSRAWAIHPDTCLIVGYGSIDDGSGTCTGQVACRHAAIWDENLQIHLLAAWAQARGVTIPAGWTLRIARDIRQVGDRVFICGWADNPQGDRQAFLLKVPFELASAGGPTTWYVDDDTCPGIGNGSIGSPFCSIQDGIIAASDGDVVEVASGVYAESIDFLGKEITVYSASGNPADTRIDASGADHVVVFSSSETPLSVLDGFTITGGNADGAFPHESGGGILCYNFAHPTVRNCIIRGNSAASVAGGVYINLGSDIDLEQCAIVGNTAPAAAALYRVSSIGNSSIINCTVAGNTSSSGAAVRDQSSSAVMSVRNCVVWNNAPAGIEPSAFIQVRHTNAQILHAGTGNISANPWFIDGNGPDNIWGTADDDLRLNRMSPCVDAGSNDDVPATVAFDLNLAPRFYDDAGITDTGDAGAMGPPIVDMGAYERQSDSFVNFTLNSGESIQDAIDEFVEGLDTEIVLNPGTYTETIDLSGKAMTLRSTDPTDPLIVAATILDGGGTQRVILCDSGEGPDTILDGVTIANGHAPDALGESGGGMVINSASPTIRNCVFMSCEANLGGGVAILSGSEPVIAGCTFVDNRAVFFCDGVCSGADGGAVFTTASTPRFDQCFFVDNTAVSRGGVVFVTNNDIGFSGCTFADNVAYEYGGAVYCQNSASELVITDCYFTRNSGGGSFVRTSCLAGGELRVLNCVFEDNSYVCINADSEDRVVNCVFTGNQFTPISGGVVINSVIYRNDGAAVGDVFGSASPVFHNSILWGNAGGEIIADDPDVIAIHNSIVQGGWVGAGAVNVIDADPLFLDPDNGDFRLNPLSPAVDAGDANQLPADYGDLDGDGDTQERTPLDLAGNPRVQFGNVDMGAHEMALLTLPAVVNTNTWTFYPTFASAINTASDNHALLAAASTFAAQAGIDFRNTAVSLSSTGDIVQPVGGLYILADDATLSATHDFDMTLNGELRIENDDAADLIADHIDFSFSGELTLRSGAALFVDAATSCTFGGDTTMLPGATLSIQGEALSSNAMTLFGNAIVNAEDNFTNTGVFNALSSNTLAVDLTLTNAGSMYLPAIDLLASSFENEPAGSVVVGGSIVAPVSNAGALTCIADTVAIGTFTNDGTTTVQIGTLNIIGTLINNGSIVGDVQTSVVAGGVSTQPGDGLSIAGDYFAGPSSSLAMPDPVWRMTLAGDCVVAITDNNNYFMDQAELHMNGGSAQTLERMSEDIGADLAGLDRTLPGHYPIGTLRIGPAASTVNAVDVFDNDGLGQRNCEAIYVRTLIIEHNATLITNGCPVYYESLILDGNVDEPRNLIQLVEHVECASDIVASDTFLPPPDGRVDGADLAYLLGEWGPNPGSLADLVTSTTFEPPPDGLVDGADLAVLLGAWGVCQ